AHDQDHGQSFRPRAGRSGQPHGRRAERAHRAHRGLSRRHFSLPRKAQAGVQGTLVTKALSSRAKRGTFEAAGKVPRCARDDSCALILPPRQLIEDRLALIVVEHGPAADLLDVALAAQTQAALAVERADADAGRHDARQRLGAVAHGGSQDFLLSSASWLCSSSSLRFRSSMAASLLLAGALSAFGGSCPLAPAGGLPPGPVWNGLNMRMARSNIAMFCLPIDSNCWKGLKPKAFCR